MRILLLLLATLPFHLSAIPDPSTARQVAKELSQIAEETTPAVVFIQVTIQKQSPFGMNRQNPLGQNQEFFNDEFWQQFFGLPKESRNRRKQFSPTMGRGSGFIVSEDGLILTNNHIVGDAEEIQVTLKDGRKYIAKILGKDENSDIAVIKIDANNLPFLTLGSSDTLRVGEWVMAVGNPPGLQGTVAVGVVSAKGRSNLGLASYEDFIQTDAAINLGNSGGPLLNLDGNVVGINTAIATRTGGYMGIGFAIPSDMASEIMERLINDGKVTRSFIGVILQEIDHDLAKSFNLDRAKGVIITDIVKDSPAEKGGLQEDDIILLYNGKKVEGIAPLRNAISLVKPGLKLDLTILRKGEEQVVNIAVDSEPEELLTKEGSTPDLGIQVEALTEILADRLGYTGEEGVIVSQIEQGSLANLAGLEQGDLIQEVNQQKIGNPAMFKDILGSLEENEQILLKVNKHGKLKRFIAIVRR